MNEIISAQWLVRVEKVKIKPARRLTESDRVFRFKYHCMKRQRDIK